MLSACLLRQSTALPISTCFRFPTSTAIRLELPPLVDAVVAVAVAVAVAALVAVAVVLAVVLVAVLAAAGVAVRAPGRLLPPGFSRVPVVVVAAAVVVVLQVMELLQSPKYPTHH